MRINGTLHEDKYTFFVISPSFLLKMRNVSDKVVVEKIKTRVCSVTFFFENRAVYEILWRNIVDRSRPQMTVWRMRIACWIPKATNTHTQVVYYLILFHYNTGCTNPL